jgi:hypothetical protein
MLMRMCVAMTLVLLACVAAIAQPSPQTLEPYPLPSGVQRSVDELAAQSDVLVLGEIHGTQEVPAVAAGLLAPLTKLGYGVLAVEVPEDQRAGLIAWTAGTTTTVPSFFARPWEDGRGSAEALSLIRAALSPPFRWKLICFDGQIAEMIREAKQGTPGESATLSESERMIALSLRRDAKMAANLADQRGQLGSQAKVLAICGNLHARTASHPAPGNPFVALWPSFAAVLQSNHPTWRVRSVNISPYSGGYFNGGKVNTFAGRPLDEAEARPTPEGDWDLELGLPRATPATFLATPINPAAPDSTGPDNRASNAVDRPLNGLPRTRHRRRCCRS